MRIKGFGFIKVLSKCARHHFLKISFLFFKSETSKDTLISTFYYTVVVFDMHIFLIQDGLPVNPTCSVSWPSVFYKDNDVRKTDFQSRDAFATARLCVSQWRSFVRH